MTSKCTAQSTPKAQAFFTEEASRQILLRIASVCDDKDLCDATFIFGDDDNMEEIRAPSQFMASSSSYFKAMFYPPTEDKRRVIPGIQGKTFRKILDYLFRGAVPLSSIEDAWKVKVAGRTFGFKELEELCTKFLKYRIDSKNLGHFLKNSTKYDTPDIREVVITRMVKDASTIFEDEQILELSETDLASILERKPDVQAKNVVPVLVNWARKKAKPDSSMPKLPSEQTEDHDMKSVNNEPSVIQEQPDGESNEVSENEMITSPGKAPGSNETIEADPKDGIENEANNTNEAEAANEDFIEPLRNLIKHVSWNCDDAEYYLKEVHCQKIMSENTKSLAMAQMLTSFIEMPVGTPQHSEVPGNQGSGKLSQRTSSQTRSQKGGKKRSSSRVWDREECEFVYEKGSKNPKVTSSVIKTEEDIVMS